MCHKISQWGQTEGLACTGPGAVISMADTINYSAWRKCMVNKELTMQDCLRNSLIPVKFDQAGL